MRVYYVFRRHQTLFHREIVLWISRLIGLFAYVRRFLDELHFDCQSETILTKNLTRLVFPNLPHCLLILAAGLLLSCASSARSSLSRPTGSKIAATSIHSSEDLSSQVDLNEEASLIDLSLRVSGYQAPDAFAAAKTQLEKLIQPILMRVLAHKDETQQAKMLLQELHGESGLLKKYNARATTLREILVHQEFNCLSASVLFALIANRAGLDVRGELLPSHARIVLTVNSRKYRIETTSKDGFNPSPQVLRRILAQSIGSSDLRSRSLVDSRGAETSTRLLIALIFVNRASIAQENAQLRVAEQLFRQGEALVNSGPMRKVLREQRAALLSQLGANDMTSEDPLRHQRAFQTMVRSAELNPEEPLIKDAVFQNLRAAAERLIAAQAVKGQSDSLFSSIVERTRQAGLPRQDVSALQAFAFSEIARQKANDGDFEGALAAMESATGQNLAPREVKLRKSLLENHVAALRLAAMTSAKIGEYTRSMQIIERLLNLQGLSVEQRRTYEVDRQQAIMLAATQAMKSRNYSKAARIYRAGRQLYPSEDTIRHNLVAALERQSLEMVNSGRCNQVESILLEIQKLDVREKFTKPARIRCALFRANQCLQNQDYLEASRWLRAVHRTYPDEPSVRESLENTFLGWMTNIVSNRECGKLGAVIQRARPFIRPTDPRVISLQTNCSKGGS